MLLEAGMVNKTMDENTIYWLLYRNAWEDTEHSKRLVLAIFRRGSYLLRAKRFVL